MIQRGIKFIQMRKIYEKIIVFYFNIIWRS